MPEIDILIKAVDQASPAIQKVEGELKKAGTTAHDTSGKFGALGSAASGVGNVLKAGLTAALVGVGAALGGMAFFLKGAVEEAHNQIQADKQLEQVIKSTGEAAGVTAQQAKDLAGSLAQVTNFTDDAIEGGESLLLTFTNIGKDVFPAATQTILDMSQALGQDLKSSAIQLGKALNDPTVGLTALSRVGVSFTEQQKEMIKTMQAAGDIAGAQAIILAELGKEFGGSAKALADPAIQLKNAWGEMQEAVGMLVIPLLNQLAQTVLPYVLQATAAVGKVVEDFNQKLKDGVPPLQALGQALYDALPPDLKTRWDTLVSDIQGALNTLVGNVQNAMGWIKLAWDTNWEGMHTTVTEFSTKTQTDTDEMLKQIRLIINNDGPDIQFSWGDLFGAMLVIQTGKLEEMSSGFVVFLKLFHGEQVIWTSLMKGDWQGVWDGMKLTLNTVVDAMLDDTQKKWGPGMRDAIATGLNLAWDKMKEIWGLVKAWWDSTFGALSLFGIGSSPTATVPNFAVVNPMNVNTPTQGWSGSNSTTNNSPVNVHVNVQGGATPYETGTNVGQGVNDELRRRGIGH